MPALPFPESLCHKCAAPPRYVESKTSVFIMCPLGGPTAPAGKPDKYPRQPVVRCPLFRPAVI